MASGMNRPHLSSSAPDIGNILYQQESLNDDDEEEDGGQHHHAEIILLDETLNIYGYKKSIPRTVSICSFE
jgi:hypothetical protein